MLDEQLWNTGVLAKLLQRTPGNTFYNQKRKTPQPRNRQSIVMGELRTLCGIDS
jgi:hypothetical protein